MLIDKNEIRMRKANENDVDTYFRWTNDEEVRRNSFNTTQINYDNHVAWFKKRLNNVACQFYFFEYNSKPLGQVRIEDSGNEVIIGISLDEAFRGLGLAPLLLEKASADYLNKHNGQKITAYIKKDNLASYKAFLKAGFTFVEDVLISDSPSYKLIRK